MGGCEGSLLTLLPLTASDEVPSARLWLLWPLPASWLQGNHLPGSYYLMKQIMEVRDISELEWHACETGCTGWQPTPKSHWHKHKDDCCKKCKGKRFKMELGRPVPVRVSVPHRCASPPGPEAALYCSV